MANDAALGASVVNDCHWAAFEVATNFACIGTELIHDLLVEIVQCISHGANGIGFFRSTRCTINRFLWTSTAYFSL
jgi:hypothetical protein